MRVDQAVSDDGRFVAVAYGPPGAYLSGIERRCEATVYHPVTREVVETITPERTAVGLGFERGRIIVGRIA
jgi:hypothetical protein